MNPFSRWVPAPGFGLPLSGGLASTGMSVGSHRVNVDSQKLAAGHLIQSIGVFIDLQEFLKNYSEFSS